MSLSLLALRSFRSISNAQYVYHDFVLIYKIMNTLIHCHCRYETPPSEKPNQLDEDPLAGLDLRKSRTGLAEVYAEQYRVEMLGGRTRAETELDKKKAALTQLFAKIMYRLDSLSHQQALPKPPKRKDGSVVDVSALTVEDTV